MERDDTIDKVRQLQDRVRAFEGLQGHGATGEVMREMCRVGPKIYYWRGIYEQVVPSSQQAMSYS